MLFFSRGDSTCKMLTSSMPKNNLLRDSMCFQNVFITLLYIFSGYKLECIQYHFQSSSLYTFNRYIKLIPNRMDIKIDQLQ